MVEALLGKLYTTVLLARLVSLEVAYRIGHAPAEPASQSAAPQRVL
jgi:hypothetical protein